MKSRILVLILITLTFLPAPLFAENLYRDTNRFAGGFQRVVMAPFRIPLAAMRGTAQAPILGTMVGVLGGAVQTVGDVVGGGFQMAGAAAPYAKYAALAL